MAVSPGTPRLHCASGHLAVVCCLLRISVNNSVDSNVEVTVTEPCFSNISGHLFPGTLVKIRDARPVATGSESRRVSGFSKFPGVSDVLQIWRTALHHIVGSMDQQHQYLETY